MSEVTLEERAYHVYSGQAEYVDSGRGQVIRTWISWAYESSHANEHAVQIAVDRLSARHQFVKIDKSGSSNE